MEYTHQVITVLISQSRFTNVFGQFEESEQILDNPLALSKEKKINQLVEIIEADKLALKSRIYINEELNQSKCNF